MNKSFLTRIALLSVCMAFGALTVFAGDHGCCAAGTAMKAECKNAKTAAECTGHGAKTASECTGHKEAACPHASGAQVKNSKYGNCPVSGEPATKSVTYSYEGTTYHFCCKDCIKDFKANPAKFSAKAKS